MGLQVSYPYFNQKSRALSSLYIVEFWTLLPYFHFQVTENPTQTGLSIKDNLFIYITKKSRTIGFRYTLFHRLIIFTLGAHFFLFLRSASCASIGLRLQMLMAAPMDWVICSRQKSW